MTLDKAYLILDSIKLDENGCMTWPNRANHYISMYIGKTFTRAHRVALERKLGRPIKPGFCALHTCENKRCVNHEHLYEGVDKDNAIDRARLSDWKAYLERLKVIKERINES